MENVHDQSHHLFFNIFSGSCRIETLSVLSQRICNLNLKYHVKQPSFMVQFDLEVVYRSQSQEKFCYKTP